MPLIRLRLRVGRTLARVLRREERSDDEHFGYASVMARCQQHAREARIERQRRDLPTEARHDAIVVDGLQFLQQLVPVVDLTRVRWIDEGKILRLTQLER